MKCRLDNRFDCWPNMRDCTMCINNPTNGVADLRERVERAEDEAQERDREIGAAVRSLMDYAHAHKLHGQCWEIELGIYCHPPHQEWYYVSAGGPRPDDWKQHDDLKTAIDYALDAQEGGKG